MHDYGGDRWASDIDRAIRLRTVQIRWHKLVARGVIVEETRNFRLIRQIATHPKVFRQISDDFSDREKWQPSESELVTYLIAKHENVPVGFMALIPRNGATAEMHFAFLPEAWGKTAEICFAQMLAYVWSHTPWRRITGEIARKNRLAIRFIVKAGCKVIGINEKSLLRGGVLEDQVILGISKP